MKRFYTLFIVALIAFTVIFFMQRPDIFNDIWLWLIGLSGAIVALFKRLLSFFKGQDEANSQQVENNVPIPISVKPQKQIELQELANDDFKGITLTVLRYADDKTTTVGLLYLNGFFYCYTLEDTYREVKIASQTRIPAGKYNLDFNRHNTDLTMKYRERYPNWFQFHLEIQHVPNYTGVYIHNGGNHTHTAGCLLVSDSLSVDGTTKTLTNSRETFRRLYTYLKTEIEKGTPVRVILRDEAWFAKLNA